MEGLKAGKLTVRNPTMAAGIQLAPVEWRQGLVIATLAMVASAALVFLVA